MARLATQQQASFRDWFHDVVTLALPADASVTDRLIGLTSPGRDDHPIRRQ